MYMMFSTKSGDYSRIHILIGKNILKRLGLFAQE